VSLFPEFSSAERPAPPGWEFISAANVTEFRGEQLRTVMSQGQLPPQVPANLDMMSDQDKQSYYAAKYQNYLSGKLYVEEYVDKNKDPGLVSELAMLLYRYSIYHMSDFTWQHGELTTKEEPSTYYSGRQLFAKEVARIAAREAE
jgi:hypothetical protein